MHKEIFTKIFTFVLNNIYLSFVYHMCLSVCKFRLSFGACDLINSTYIYRIVCVLMNSLQSHLYVCALVDIKAQLGTICL